MIEKQAYALVKSLKSFQVYILYSKVIAYVPNIAVKDVLVQPDIEGKRGRWIAKITEFDLEIRSTKLIKGQGIAHLLVEFNCKVLDLNLISNMQGQIPDSHIQPYPDYLQSEWYKDIVYFLQNLSCLTEMERSKVWAFKLKDVRYCLIDSQLYWRDPAGIMLKSIDENDPQRIMTELHRGACGGHLYWKSIVNKILRDGYYWPKLFSDVFAKVRACMECQKIAGKDKLLPLPLKPISISAPFQ